MGATRVALSNIAVTSKTHKDPNNFAILSTPKKKLFYN